MVAVGIGAQFIQPQTAVIACMVIVCVVTQHSAAFLAIQVVITVCMTFLQDRTAVTLAVMDILTVFADPTAPIVRFTLFPIATVLCAEPPMELVVPTPDTRMILTQLLAAMDADTGMGNQVRGGSPPIRLMA